MDLHHYHPRDTKSITRAFIYDSYVNKESNLKIITGKGIGIKFNQVVDILKNHPFIKTFQQAPNWESGRGAIYFYFKENVIIDISSTKSNRKSKQLFNIQKQFSILKKGLKNVGDICFKNSKFNKKTDCLIVCSKFVEKLGKFFEQNENFVVKYTKGIYILEGMEIGGIPIYLNPYLSYEYYYVLVDAICEFFENLN